MEIGRVLLHLVSNMESLVPAMIFCAGVTLFCTMVLYFLAGDVWFDHARFRVLGVFFGLGNYDCYRLSLSWIRLLLTIYFVVSFRELDTVAIVAFLMIGILYVLDLRKPRRIIKNALWMLIVTASLFAVNLVCGYIKTLITFDWKAWVIYVFMSIFMCLFALYLFMQELEDISSDRKLDPEKEYERILRDDD